MVPTYTHTKNIKLMTHLRLFILNLFWKNPCIEKKIVLENY